MPGLSVHAGQASGTVKLVDLEYGFLKSINELGELMSMLQRFAVAIVVIVLAPVAFAATAHAAPKLLTYQQIAALPVAEQTAIFKPLRTVANAAGAVGRTDRTDVYSGLRIDAPSGTVTVYLTDLAHKAEFLAAVQRRDPAADVRLVRFVRGAYTYANLKAATSALTQRQKEADLTIDSVAVRGDGSGLRVQARDVARAKRALGGSTNAVAVAGRSVPVVVEATQAGSDLSRLRDSPQWISGAALTQTSDAQARGWTCTSGLPARRNSDGRSFLITAAHCYGNGATVFTGWQNGGRNRIGVVTNRAGFDDAIAIDTSSTGTTASREWDGPPGGPYQVLDVTGTALSWNGDMTCQDGYTSGIVCGLLVEDDYIEWTGSDGVLHRGVQARQVNGSTAGRGGDSGGLVFALEPGNIREARGQVSFGGGTTLRWTEAPFILSTLGMSLAP
jgi:hypothetical protein